MALQHTERAMRGKAVVLHVFRLHMSYEMNLLFLNSTFAFENMFCGWSVAISLFPSGRGTNIVTEANILMRAAHVCYCSVVLANGYSRLH